MNSGTIVTKALNRCLLPVNDYATRDIVYGMLNEVVQYRWSAGNSKMRSSRFFFNTASGIEEYALHKLSDGVMMNTMRGSSPVRKISYEPTSDFYQRRNYDLETGDPYFYRDGTYSGVQVQPSASSVITLSSSLANFTTGTVDAMYGRLFFNFTGTITLDMVGRFVRVGTDDKRYRIVKVHPASGGLTRVDVDSPYEGVSAAAASFAIGDVGQKATVLGLLDNDSVYEEEIQLNGSTTVATNASFASLIRISKSDKTHGYISATSNAGVVTNVTLDPGETEADFKTIKLYPIPTKTERIEFESYSRHPNLYKFNDVPLLPSQFHELLLIDLIIKIKDEFIHEAISQTLLERQSKLETALDSWSNNIDDWTASPSTDDFSTNRKQTNLPSDYGIDDGFDSGL